MVLPALVSLAGAAVPSQALACDPNCPTVLALAAGVPAAAATSLVAPVVGRAAFARPDVPYWSAAGISAVASGVAVLAVRSWMNPLTIERGDVAQMIAAPAVAGAAATALVYWLWPRGAADANRSRAWGPSLSAGAAGGIHLVWRLQWSP